VWKPLFTSINILPLPSTRLYFLKGPNIPVELLDNKELLAVVKDGYILSRIERKELKKGFLEDIRRFYKVDNTIKVWID